ncbi:hypothetical protein EVAR_52872_1 [Eumeta japonica]|uniref:Uncharacterized protein n=1 Tax=Eumeta variegata TaxID=151549 RepID=A0A4C1YIC2_EUMVA|nr:hypothetical protein EVAR_52872_1 [Eumeta japonica]
MAKKNQNWNQDRYWNSGTGVGPDNGTRMDINNGTVSRNRIHSENDFRCGINGNLSSLPLMFKGGSVSRSVSKLRAGWEPAPSLKPELTSRTGPRSRSKLANNLVDIEDDGINSMFTGAKPGITLNKKKKC